MREQFLIGGLLEQQLLIGWGTDTDNQSPPNRIHVLL
jgi:hypothetical protein